MASFDSAEIRRVAEEARMATEERSGCCMVCGGKPRPGWNEEVIFGPAAKGDGFREPIGWAHPRCLKVRLSETLEHLALMAPTVAILDPVEAKRLELNVADINSRLEDNGSGCFAAVNLEIARIVRVMADGSAGSSAQAKVAWKVIEGLSHLGHGLFTVADPTTLVPAYPDLMAG